MAQMGMFIDGVIDAMPVYVKELVAGGVAGGMAKSVVAPLERIKILFQFAPCLRSGCCPGSRLRNEYVPVTKKVTRGAGERHDQTSRIRSIGLFGSVKKIARTEGVMGFYRGNGASLARIVPYAALHYMTYEQYRRWIILAFPDMGRGPVLDLVAGSFAGGTAVLFTYPLDLVRTKLAYQVVGSSNLNAQSVPKNEKVYKGILDCFSKTHKEAGFRGLYRGVAPSLYGIFPYAGLKFYCYEEMKRHVPQEHKSSIIVKLVCGSVAGLLGQTFTYPLDVVRRQMQVQRHLTSNSAEIKGTIETLVMIAQKQGWKMLFSGLSINYLKVVPSVAIGFTGYDLMKSWLRVPPRDEPDTEVVSGTRSGTPTSFHS